MEAEVEAAVEELGRAKGCYILPKSVELKVDPACQVDTSQVKSKKALKHRYRSRIKAKVNAFSLQKARTRMDDVNRWADL